jgi:hypothetical protein
VRRFLVFWNARRQDTIVIYLNGLAPATDVILKAGVFHCDIGAVGREIVIIIKVVLLTTGILLPTICKPLEDISRPVTVMAEPTSWSAHCACFVLMPKHAVLECVFILTHQTAYDSIFFYTIFVGTKRTSSQLTKFSLVVALAVAHSIAIITYRADATILARIWFTWVNNHTLYVIILKVLSKESAYACETPINLSFGTLLRKAVILALIIQLTVHSKVSWFAFADKRIGPSICAGSTILTGVGVAVVAILITAISLPA